MYPSLPTDTVQMPALRLLPPVQPDRPTGWRLSRRRGPIRDLIGGTVIAGVAMFIVPIADALRSAIDFWAGVQ